MKAVIKELQGAFGLLMKSVRFPGEVVAARKGSPLVVGVRTQKKMKVDFVDVEFGEGGDVSTLQHTPSCASEERQSFISSSEATFRECRARLCNSSANLT